MRLRVALEDAYRIHMRGRSSRTTISSKFRRLPIYDIPERSYIQNIGDSFLRDEEDFMRIIAVRGDDEPRRPARRLPGGGEPHGPQQTPVVHVLRLLESRAHALDIQALKFYQKSDESTHIFNVKPSCT